MDTLNDQFIIELSNDLLARSASVTQNFKSDIEKYTFDDIEGLTESDLITRMLICKMSLEYWKNMPSIAYQYRKLIKQKPIKKGN